MNKEQIKLKIQRLYNQYNAGNYPHVIREAGIILRKLPNNYFLMNLIGSCFQKIGQIDKAKIIFEDIIALDKTNIAALNNLGNVLKILKDLNLAEETYKEALKINPNFANCLQNYANLKFDLNENEAAIELYNKAISVEPNNYLSHYNLGLVFQALGKFDEARVCLNKVIELNPKFTNADKILSRFTNYKKGDLHIEDMQNRLKNTNLDEYNKANILFALGKAYEDIKEFKKSFEFLENANYTLKKLTKYKFKADDDIFKNLIKKFDNIKFDNLKINSTNKKYIFIVGLPRSGTSLIEQILSSHSNVYGAGELPHLADAIKEEFFEDNNLSFKNDISINNQLNHEMIFKSFNKNINSFNFKEEYLTDKNPLNFLWIGFIRLIFPNSKVLHIKRNIKDNYFSLYKNAFDGNMNWCYDKSDLLNYCINYSELMSFWEIKIPNYILNIEYENIISNTKIEVQKILAHCDLPWEDKCLKFYKTERAIKTVSSAQARKPIYKSSIKSYENYKYFLADFFSKLEKKV